MKRDEFKRELKSVLEEIEAEREYQEDIVYKEFLSSGLADEYQPSEEFRQRILTLAAEREEKSQKVRTKGVYLPRRIAVALLALLCSLLATVVLQASGYSLLEFLHTPSYTEVRVSNKFRRDYIERITDGKVYFPEYIPKGYVLDEIQSKNLYVKTTFRKGKDEITIIQMAQSQDITTFMDSENAYVDEQIQIGGSIGQYIYKDGFSSLVLSKETYHILIIGSLDKKETIKIANSLS